MVGKVTTWHMSEEERQAYIKKHPIKKTKPHSGATFVNLDFEANKMRAARGRDNRRCNKKI